MRALVIYDLTGRVWSITYGESNIPQGIFSIFVEIPAGMQLSKIDVSDLNNPKPVFTDLPESDIGKLRRKIESLETQLTETQLALTEQYEANLALEDEVMNTQLALTELYESREE
jgi:hypothetical protein